MSIEEIIKALEGFQRMSEGISGVVNDPERKAHYAERAQALREAIALLKTHQDAQPNEPLTMEELREMEGKPVPVWCDKENGYIFIATTKTDPYNQVWYFSHKGFANTALYYSTKFYRRPPKED